MPSARFLSRLEAVDWDFARSYSESPFSALHWHPGRFASQIPATLIGLMTNPGDCVLDPFAGSGTTLVEAQRLGRRSIGIDVSPVAALMSRAKTLTLDGKSIGRAIGAIVRDCEHYVGAQPEIGIRGELDVHIPASVQGTKWYSPRVRRALGVLWSLIGTYSEPRRTIATAAFSSILLPVCRETRHWGYVCDNTAPRGVREVDVAAEYVHALRRLADAYRIRDEELQHRKLASAVEADFIIGNVIEALDEIPPKSIDAIITSPPYFGVCDYVKSQRLTLEWLELDIEPLRLREIGARSKRHRKTAAEQYVDEMVLVLSKSRRILRKGGSLALVVGESKQRDNVLDVLLQRLAGERFEPLFDADRRVSVQRRQTPSIDDERILVFRV